MIYTQNKDYTLYKGTMQEELSNLEDNSVDSIVTDPPYELGFMGKSWDSSGVAYQIDTWKECLRVLKPGGYMLAFGGTRTYHRICCAIEDAGFEIRDCIMWLYGSGFPKSMNIGLAIDKHNGVESPVVGQNPDILKKQAKDIREGHRKIQDSFNSGSPDRNNGFKTISADIRQAQNEWGGWGTCLKPAYEPIIVARKPFKGSLVNNILEFGVGGLNIDGCRVPIDIAADSSQIRLMHRTGVHNGTFDSKMCGLNKDSYVNVLNTNGRFPANIITDGSKEVAAGFPYTKGSEVKEKCDFGFCFDAGKRSNKPMADGYNDEGSAMRYFYCAKASKKDRDEGLDKFETKTKVFNGQSNQSSIEMKDVEKRFTTQGKNIHPTVKPTELMQYLVRLVSPKGATILDPFMGSGSTGKAVMFENRERNSNYKFIGVEMTDEYLPICKARIDFANNYKDVQDDTSINRSTEKVIKYKVEKLF